MNFLKRVLGPLFPKIPSKVFESCDLCGAQFERSKLTCCSRCLSRIGAELRLPRRST